MKILLVQSYMGDNEPAIFPIGLACIKSSLTGHEVKVFDANTSSSHLDDLRKVLWQFRPHVVGISLRNIDSTNKRTVVFYYAHLRDLLAVVKSHCNAKVVIGGSGFSMFAAEIMEQEPQIDFGVYLEGETVFPLLLDSLDTPERVPSVFYRKDDKVFFTEAAPPCNLDQLAMPDWTILSIPNYTVKDAIGIETKRGCQLGCIYCIYGFLSGKQYRLKDPHRVVDEIEHLALELKVKRFMFLDSVFNIPKAHSEAICREILRREVKVKWSAWFNEANLSEDYIALIGQAGCDGVMLSPDALDDSVLKTLGKNLHRKDVLRAFRLLQESNLFNLSYNFFKNPPGQTIRNFVGIALFYLKAKWQLRRRVHFEFNAIRIQPHTRLFDIALQEGAIFKEKPLLYPVYYTNRKTRFTGALFDLLLALKGK